MPTKAEQYAQMADQVARQLTGSWQEWAGFLTTVARLYKYPFHEQLMIYAQRPDATACAEYDLWNNRMGRYVRRGSKGNLRPPDCPYLRHQAAGRCGRRSVGRILDGSPAGHSLHR